MNVDDILAENARRLIAVNAPFDPIAGDPDDPGRFLFDVGGLRAWLPLSMRTEPLVRLVGEHKSLEGYLLATFNSADSLTRERFLSKWNFIRSRHDFPFWAASFVYIKRKGGGDDTLFILNRPQRKLVGKLEEMRRDGQPIRLILLKARQWGGSTCVQLYMAWLQLVHSPGLNSLIIAHQGCASDEIKDMFDRMIRQYPEEMLREAADYDAASKPDSADSPVEIGKKRVEIVGGAGAAFRVISRNCKVKIGTAERPDSCRGGDYNLVHCSEVGLWRATKLKTPEQISRAACSGVLYKPLTMILFESTANGTGNFFHREYEAAKRGSSQYRALFVAWFEINQYSLPFRSPDEERQFAATLLDEREAEQSPDDRRQPGQYLWWLWEKGASLEAIHWYVAERAKYSDHALMAAEYPSDDVEAFVHSGASVFDRYCVEALRDGCRAPLLRGEIDGDSHSGPGSLKNVRFSPSSSGALAVWKDREVMDGARVTDRYLVVVDIGGRSANADWSVITVFDRYNPFDGNRPEVAAQWRGHTDFDLLAWNAARIATYYDNALLVIESNTLETNDPSRMGEADQSCFLLGQLRDAYPNLYARRRSEADVRQGAPVKYGFHTNVSTKPMVISNLVQAIREGLYIERDEACLSEFLSYEKRQNGSYGALPGFHDDLLMTRAIGLHISFMEMDPPKLRECGTFRPLDRPFSAASW